MHVHTAVFKWKDGVTEEDLAETFAVIRSLQDLVPGIVGIYAGANYSPRNQGFTHGVVILCRSKDALDAFRAHPVHTEIGAKVQAIEAEGIGLDFSDAGTG